MTDNEQFEEIDYLQYVLEAAIAFWVCNKFSESYQLFAEFVEKLYKLKGLVEPAEYWTKLFSIGGHCLGYIAHSVKTDGRQEADSDYFVPKIGIFITNNREWDTPHDVSKESYAFAQLALFAEGIDELERANDWASVAFDTARSCGDLSMMSLIATTCGQYGIINAKFAQSFEQLFIAALCFVYSSDKDAANNHKVVDDGALGNFTCVF